RGRGEMGRFRNTLCLARIAMCLPAVIYSLDRPRLERMQREHPEAYAAFLRFVVRTLSDRLEHANRKLVALNWRSRCPRAECAPQQSSRRETSGPGTTRTKP